MPHQLSSGASRQPKRHAVGGAGCAWPSATWRANWITNYELRRRRISRNTSKLLQIFPSRRELQIEGRSFAYTERERERFVAPTSDSISGRIGARKRMSAYRWKSFEEDEDRPEKPRRYGVTEIRGPHYSSFNQNLLQVPLFSPFLFRSLFLSVYLFCLVHCACGRACGMAPMDLS